MSVREFFELLEDLIKTYGYEKVETTILSALKILREVNK